MIRIEHGFAQQPVVLLLGPRQCGKTTLARHYEGRPDVHWFDLENYLHRSRVEDNPMATLGQLRGRVIIDEVQVLPELLLLLANHHGQAVNASALARDIGVDFKTVQRYLDVLDGAYMLRTLPPFHTNVAKRVRKTPKLYFRDTGILHALLGLGTPEQVDTSGRMGFSWEGFCLEQLIREAEVDGEDCFHYSVQGGAELDMVTSLGGSVFGFEFKHGDVPTITRSMREAAEDLKVRRVFVIYPGPDTFALDPDERFVAVAWRDIATLRTRMAIGGS